MAISASVHSTINSTLPGSGGRGIFGTAREFQKAPLAYLAQIHREYGDSLRYRLFLNWYGYSFVHPDANKHILQENDANYTNPNSGPIQSASTRSVLRPVKRPTGPATPVCPLAVASARSSATALP